MNRISHISLIIILAALAAVGMQSCTDDTFERFGSDPDRILLPGEYRFIISCDDDALPHPASRVGYESVTASRFETGDHIGVFASNSERQIQNDVFAARNMNDDSEIQVLAPPAGKVTQDLDTVIPSGDEIDYLFYYPMNETWTRSKVIQDTGLTIGVEADQSTKEGYEKSDFLWNFLPADPGAEYQVIKMHHLMANIVVKIHRDSIDTSDGRGVTLCNFPISASDIHLTRGDTPGEMNYTPQMKLVTDISMFQHGESGEYLIYRAVVPAWHTLPAGTEIIKCNLYNRAGEVEEVTFSLAKDLELRDGYYYNFTLRSEFKAAVPDVTDEDSWVLDVFDPETNEIVGLLCREYLRYQPDHTGENNINTMDELTGTEYPAANSKYISSQAWVFYNLVDSDRKIPDLKHGTVLRFIYDVRASFNPDRHPDTEAAWPAPHTKGVLPPEDDAQGVFLAEHGHRWVKGVTSGESSKDFVENYMHGGTITWEPETSPDGVAYHKISEFILPEEKITNHVAKNYGHIAVDPTDGSVKVSYAKFSGDPASGGNIIYDDENCKVAYVLQHYLVDEIDEGGDMRYPLVKIGYNNFWMSSSLRRTNHSGIGLTRLNGDDDDPFKEYVNIDTQLPAGYLYPFNAKIQDDYQFPDSGKDFAVLRDCYDQRSKFSLLYNFTAVGDENFVPSTTGDIAPDDRFTCFLPEEKHFNRILHYFGWKFAAKLMSTKVRITLETNRYGESIKDALMDNKFISISYNSYAPNVSGFNLRSAGAHYYNSGMGDSFGFVCSIWLNNDYYSETPGPMKAVCFPAHQVFQPNATPASLYETLSAGNISDVQRSSQFYGVRFTMMMKGQDNSELLLNSHSVSRSSSAHSHAIRQNRVVSVHLNEL